MSGVAGAAPSKVARVTLWFWIMKICATTVGETGGDMLSMTLNLGYAAGSILLVSLFWIAFVLTRPFGATMGDLLTKPAAKGGPGFDIIGSSAVLMALLTATILWSMGREGRKEAPP